MERRAVLRGIGAAGVLAGAAPLLAACMGRTPPGQVDLAGAGGSVRVPTDSIPVGGGVVSGPVVVTQPEQGTFKAFSSVCTHQSCTVGSVSDNVIHCPCHGSQFSGTDGSVVQGPARVALPAFTASVSAGEVVVTSPDG